MSQVATLMEHFDATQFDPTQSGGGNFPIGKHPVQIVGSAIEPTKDNQSGMLVFSLEVIDGPHKGMTGKHRLNMYHTNPDTARIARQQLSAICHVVQTYNIGNSVGPLHNKPFIIEVVPQKDPQYTQIQKVYDMQGNEPGKSNGGAAPAAQPVAQPGFGGGQPAAPAEQPAQPAWQNNNAPAANAGNGGWQNNNAPAAQPTAQPTQNGWQGNGGGQPAAAGGATPPWGQPR